ncbi:hypothetical protein J1614_001200 [Plenodomus biglobosus]|nr:hypothetical protein J1614_001200 [Plenodomus biglobosus]
MIKRPHFGEKSTEYLQERVSQLILYKLTNRCRYQNDTTQTSKIIEAPPCQPRAFIPLLENRNMCKMRLRFVANRRLRED